MYRIYYTKGNGYKCGCCRRTYDEWNDVESLEEAKAFISRCKAFEEEDSDYDFRLDKVTKIQEEDVTSEVEDDTETK